MVLRAKITNLGIITRTFANTQEWRIIDKN